MRRRLYTSLMAICCMLPATLQAVEPVPEYAMKAAFLYNFALFTEWPGQLGGNLNLCVLGHDPFGSALDAIDGKEIKSGRRLTIRHISNPANAVQCHMLYFGAVEVASIGNLLADLGDVPVLTVTDAGESSGAMIHMWLENKRLVFGVDQDAALRAHLTFSSKMLRLARRFQQ